MSEDLLELTGDFPEPDREAWLDAVDKVLGERGFADVLESTTPDGITIRPLYTAADGSEMAAGELPHRGAWRRGSSALGTTVGWDVRQRHRWGEARALNEAILRDLDRGVTSIDLVVGVDDDISELAAVLDGVLLDLAPVALSTSDSGIHLASAFLDVLGGRKEDASSVCADLGCDPLASAAASGSVSGVESAITEVAELGRRVASSYPAMRTLTADGTVYGSAGCTAAHELALVASTGLTYVRALVSIGLDETQAFAQVFPVISMDADQFGGVAKVRALRVIWGRIVEASGAQRANIRFGARMSPAIVTQRDPWTNLLRGTICCFAAATAGADIITLEPFDSAIGSPDAFGLRLSRNTQLALLEESNLHRVIDPAGGSWFIESLTDDLARAAWSKFQELERLGGVIEGLVSGSIQSDIATAAAATDAAVATRADAITGVSEFPDLNQPLLSRPPVNAAAVAAPTEVEPVRSRRIAAPFEALRDAADSAETNPSVFMAALGPASAHNARSGWARGFFEAGGIRTSPAEGFDSAEALVRAYQADGSRLAVLCSSDEVYASLGVEVAEALKTAGVDRLYLAGRPRDLVDALTDAGVDEFIHVGVDVVDSLQRAQDVLGITPKGDR
ncbi:MAG: methylmalonyl-CoA mutase family protein [Acidimicrobiales bacterium]